MRLRSVWACVLISLCATGCFLQRDGTLGEDGAAAPDGSPSPEDAATADGAAPLDSSVVPPDASPPDATPPPPDAPVEPDAMVDPDAGSCTIVSTTVCFDVDVDEDCDGVVDEACDCSADGSRAGDACSPGFATCEGRVECAAGGLSCVVATATSECNGRDDDCDGTIDEDSDCGTATGCTPFVFGASSYLICASNRTYTEARDFCIAQGYALVTIETMDEDAALISAANSADSNDEFWIGLNDLDDDDEYEWLSGSAATYRESGFGAQRGECAVIDTNGSGDWSDRNCGDDQFSICEVDPG